MCVQTAKDPNFERKASQINRFDPTLYEQPQFFLKHLGLADKIVLYLETDEKNFEILQFESAIHSELPLNQWTALYTPIWNLTWLKSLVEKMPFRQRLRKTTGTIKVISDELVKGDIDDMWCSNTLAVSSPNNADGMNSIETNHPKVRIFSFILIFVQFKSG